MKKLLAILLSLVVVFGCEDKDKEDKKEPQLRDAEVAGEMMPEEEGDMGLDGGSEEDQGGEEAGAEQEELDGGQDASDEEDCAIDCEEEPCEC